MKVTCIELLLLNGRVVELSIVSPVNRHAIAHLQFSPSVGGLRELGLRQGFALDFGRDGLRPRFLELLSVRVVPSDPVDEIRQRFFLVSLVRDGIRKLLVAQQEFRVFFVRIIIAAAQFRFGIASSGGIRCLLSFRVVHERLIFQKSVQAGRVIPHAPFPKVVLDETPVHSDFLSQRVIYALLLLFGTGGSFFLLALRIVDDVRGIRWLLSLLVACRRCALSSRGRFRFGFPFFRHLGRLCCFAFLLGEF
mmetsp:Transcript_15745/g.36434  ORF Transcript_15745/g.36434 Transcript_15745/m.36434 type:complete len:250 (+) Transcript_15745:1009-1758(+)